MTILRSDALGLLNHGGRGQDKAFEALLRELIDGQVNNPLTLGTPVGITGGTGTIINATQRRQGKYRLTRIFINLTGLGTSTTDLDVIGKAGGAAYLTQIKAAAHGAPCWGRMICLETPATGADDIDLYSATVGTAVFDDGIAALTETAHVTSGAAWVAGVQKPFTLAIPADNYLYLVNGEAGTVGDYTAGKFLIEIEGYDA
jgi:hypothetical protein